MTRLAVDFLGTSLRTPLVLASGIWGTSVSLLSRAAHNGCGAVTAKSCGPVERTGHVNPTCIDWGHGLINAIGLANPGVHAEVELLKAAALALEKTGTPLIASIFAGSPQEFATVARAASTAHPAFIELNISCPNVASEFGEPFAGSPAAAAEVTAAVKEALQETGIPVIVKLAPNVPSVARVACAVVDAGADALCAINTMPGMLIDAAARQPVLANRSGGISGAALKPIALKCVYDLYSACPQTPIIGTGGITTGLDAIEMIMAGATVVGVGSAVYTRGASAIHEICVELDSWLAVHGVDGIQSLRGAAHERIHYDASPSSPPVPPVH
ncbi:MAG: dihydroorotate dehydrogenase [Caldilineaceae bacterium]